MIASMSVWPVVAGRDDGEMLKSKIGDGTTVFSGDGCWVGVAF